MSEAIRMEAGWPAWRVAARLQAVADRCAEAATDRGWAHAADWQDWGDLQSWREFGAMLATARAWIGRGGSVLCKVAAPAGGYWQGTAAELLDAAAADVPLPPGEWVIDMPRPGVARLSRCAGGAS